MRTALALAAIAVATFGVAAASQTATQSPPLASSWDVTQARGTTRDIDLTTREGTWMSLDVSRFIGIEKETGSLTTAPRPSGARRKSAG